MEKNIGTQEAHMRTITAVVLLLLALFIETAFIKVLLALISAALAATAFLRTCPVNFILKRDTYDGGEPVILPPVTSVPAEELEDSQVTTEKSNVSEGEAK